MKVSDEKAQTISAFLSGGGGGRGGCGGNYLRLLFKFLPSFSRSNPVAAPMHKIFIKITTSNHT
jgi:hypothetical protein